MQFPDSIEATYRVVRTQHGIGEADAEYTIPLGSWRKGRGLEGSRGHVYRYGHGWSGVWIKRLSPRRFIDGIRGQIPEMAIMQVGTGAATFRVPMDDLADLLPMLNAKRLRTTTDAMRNALAKARAASPLVCARGQKPS